jgi:hypothetical protein
MRATKVEDGHSATQNALYWHLWRQGQHVKGSRSRFVQAGYGVIQAALKIDRSNIQDAIRELQKKHSIRVVQSSTVGTATVYEVFSCDDILLKRRELGLLWVQRFGTRRVDFVSEEDVDQTLTLNATGLEDTGITPIGPTPTGSAAAGFTPGMGPTPTEAIGAAPIEGIGVTPIQLVNRVKSSKTTSATIATIVDAIRSEFGQADDQAARRIIEECRRRASDVTDSEIALQVRLQAKRLRGISSVENPIGLLITQVPKCFEGESFRQFRSGGPRGRGREEEPVQIPSERQLQEYQAIVEDPRASQAEKRIAQNLLRLGQKG